MNDMLLHYVVSYVVILSVVLFCDVFCHPIVVFYCLVNLLFPKRLPGRSAPFGFSPAPETAAPQQRPGVIVPSAFFMGFCATEINTPSKL